MRFDVLVYIGRFQPFHKGHEYVIRESLKISERVIVVIGSHNSSPSVRNPLSSIDRYNMIQQSLQDVEGGRIVIVGQTDHLYNEDRWISSIQSLVYNNANKNWNPGPTKIGIVGYDKDHSSYYLKKFPQWELVTFEPYMHNGKVLSSTDIRNNIYEGRDHSYNDILSFNTKGIAIKKIDLLKKEYEFVKTYKKQWETTPYPVTFTTVDSVVVQSGHVLLVERGAAPGEGLVALPGGFINPEETILQSTLRELTEETKLKVPIPVLVGSIQKREIYDNPHRSDRGRTITIATYFKLNDQEKLPKIKGSDDARKAFWMPFKDIINNRDKFFEDHYCILEHMIGI